MKISEKGIEFIIKEEGERLTAYKCAAGVWTIGVGHTGKDVYQGLKITKEQSRNLLSKDIEKFEKAVERQITAPLNQAQFDALVSFTFNLGEGNLQKSTLRKKINSKASAVEIRTEFNKWKTAAGKVLQGLINRRKREADLFILSKYN